VKGITYCNNSTINFMQKLSVWVAQHILHWERMSISWLLLTWKTLQCYHYVYVTSKFTCMQMVCLPLPTPNMFNIGCNYKATPPICQMTNYQKIVVLYSGKYGIWEISYSRILPDELLVAQMNQEIPWHFCNLSSYYKPETGWFMKGETSIIGPERPKDYNI